MRTASNISGARFGRLVARYRVPQATKTVSRWLCACDCGRISVARLDHLRAGSTKSCGCGQAPPMRHGGAKRGVFAKEYTSFNGAKQRCTNPNVRQWPWYGGRGIEFRFASFEQFLAHIGPRPAGTSLDRIDVNGHYEPGNVRWANPTEQARNRRPMARKQCA